MTPENKKTTHNIYTRTSKLKISLRLHERKDLYSQCHTCRLMYSNINNKVMMIIKFCVRWPGLIIFWPKFNWEGKQISQLVLGTFGNYFNSVEKYSWQNLKCKTYFGLLNIFVHCKNPMSFHSLAVFSIDPQWKIQKYFDSYYIWVKINYSWEI